MRYHSLQIGFFLSLLIGAAVLMAAIVLPYLTPLVFAIILAVMFWPMHVRLLRLLGNQAMAAAMLSTLIVVTAVLLPLTMFGTIAIHETRQLVGHLSQAGVVSDYLERLIALQERYFGTTSLAPNPDVSAIDQAVREVMRYIASRAASWLSSAAATLLQMLVFFLALYYSFKDGPRWRDYLVSISPLADRYDTRILEKIHRTIISVIRGALLMAIIQGILTGVGFAIFGVPAPVLWGTLTVLISFVPWLGTSLTIVPAVIFLILEGATVPAIGLAIWGATVVGLIDNVLTPSFISSQVKIHPLPVLLSVFGGLHFFGAAGLFLGPIVLSLLLALLDIYQNEFRHYLKGSGRLRLRF